MTALKQIRSAFERARLAQRPVDVKVVTEAARAARSDGTVDALERDELRRQWALTSLDGPAPTEQAKRQFLALAKAFHIGTPAALADGKYSFPLERVFVIGTQRPGLTSPVELVKQGDTFSLRYDGEARGLRLDSEGRFRIESLHGFVEGQLRVLDDGTVKLDLLEHPFGRYRDLAYAGAAAQHVGRVSTRGLPLTEPERTELVVSGNDGKGAVVSARVQLAADSETHAWLELPAELLGGAGTLRVPLQPEGTLNLETKGLWVRGAIRDGKVSLDLSGSDGRSAHLTASLGVTIPVPAALPTEPQLRWLAQHPELGVAQGLPRTELVGGEPVKVVDVTGPQYPGQRAWLVENGGEQHVVGFFLSAYQAARAELGKPTGPETIVGGVRRQPFERGLLVFDGEVRKVKFGFEPGERVKQRAAAMGARLSHTWYAMGDGRYHQATIGGTGGYIAANPALEKTFWVPARLSNYFDGHPERLENLGLPIGELQSAGYAEWQAFERGTLVSDGGLPELRQSGWQPGQRNALNDLRW